MHDQEHYKRGPSFSRSLSLQSFQRVEVFFYSSDALVRSNTPLQPLPQSLAALLTDDVEVVIHDQVLGDLHQSTLAAGRLLEGQSAVELLKNARFEIRGFLLEVLDHLYKHGLLRIPTLGLVDVHLRKNVGWALGGFLRLVHLSDLLEIAD